MEVTALQTELFPFGPRGADDDGCPLLYVLIRRRWFEASYLLYDIYTLSTTATLWRMSNSNIVNKFKNNKQQQ